MRSERRVDAAQGREALAGWAEEDGLLAVAREAGLHEELHVAAAVGAGDVEAGRAAPRTVAKEVLDEAEADVPRVAVVDGVELDDGPFVPAAVSFHARQASQSSVLFVDVDLVVRLEGTQGHAEEAEDGDVAGGHGQAQGAGGRVARFAGGVASAAADTQVPIGLWRVRQSGELAHGGQVRDAGGADAS